MKVNERMWVGMRICEGWIGIYKGYACIECNEQSREREKCAQCV